MWVPGRVIAGHRTLEKPRRLPMGAHSSPGSGNMIKSPNLRKANAILEAPDRIIEFLHDQDPLGSF